MHVLSDLSESGKWPSVSNGNRPSSRAKIQFGGLFIIETNTANIGKQQKREHS